MAYSEIEKDVCDPNCQYLDCEKQECAKYNAILIFYDWFFRCDECLDDPERP